MQRFLADQCVNATLARELAKLGRADALCCPTLFAGLNDTPPYAFTNSPLIATISVNQNMRQREKES